MIDLPQWLEDKIKEIGMECPNCGKNIRLESIVAIGVKEYEDEDEKEKKDRNSYLVMEHTCDYCHKTYGFDITECDVKKFVLDMLQKYGALSSDEDALEFIEEKQEKQDNIKESVKKNIKSGISQKEVDNFNNMMKDCKSWADIMEKAGISSEDMERYTKDSAKDK